jgi:hypothetical protein
MPQVVVEVQTPLVLLVQQQLGVPEELAIRP